MGSSTIPFIFSLILVIGSVAAVISVVVAVWRGMKALESIAKSLNRIELKKAS